jgi:hypothetical protein
MSTWTLRHQRREKCCILHFHFSCLSSFAHHHVSVLLPLTSAVLSKCMWRPFSLHSSRGSFHKWTCFLKTDDIIRDWHLNLLWHFTTDSQTTVTATNKGRQTTDKQVLTPPVSTPLTPLFDHEQEVDVSTRSPVAARCQHCSHRPWLFARMTRVDITIQQGGHLPLWCWPWQVHEDFCQES